MTDSTCILGISNQWVSKFDNTHWAPEENEDGSTTGSGYWDSTSQEWVADIWVSDSTGDQYYGLYLTAIGTWYNTYRPTMIRITYTGDISSMDFYGWNYAYNIWQNYSYENQEHELILWEYGEGDVSGDLSSIWIESVWEGPFSVTNIEFYEHCVPIGKYGLRCFDGDGNITLDVIDRISRVLFTKKVDGTDSDNQILTIPEGGIERSFAYAYALDDNGGLSHSVTLAGLTATTMRVSWTSNYKVVFGAEVYPAVDSLIVVLGW